MLFQVGKELCSFERENSVAVRWKATDEQYQETLQIQVISKCNDLLAKMKPVSQECLFLLKLKEKYSGTI